MPMAEQRAQQHRLTLIKSGSSDLSLETMLIVALIYLILTLVLSRLVGLLEERLHKNNG